MLLVQSVSHFYSVSPQCKRLSIQKVQNDFSLCVIFVLTLTDLLSLNHWEKERESENLSELLTPSPPLIMFVCKQYSYSFTFYQRWHVSQCH